MEAMSVSVGFIGEAGGREVQDAAALKGVKVMVIDDSNTIRRSAEIFLLQAGCTVILADDGFDALAKIADHEPDLIFVDIRSGSWSAILYRQRSGRAHGPRSWPDLIFVDIMMPRLDGYQTCALI